MDFEYIARHWYAHWYESAETWTTDTEFLLHILKEQGILHGARLLEIACGGGRIAIPLAQAGYDVTGFDGDAHMLINCYRKARGIPNLRCYQMKAEAGDWGEGFDVVVFAGNLLINIESDMDYRESQKLFIGKAAQALKPGGHLFLDFDLHFDPASVFHNPNGHGENEYTDDMGTVGRSCFYGSIYDSVTQICAGASHTEFTTNNSERFIVPRLMRKHIPTQKQVYEWIRGAGLEIEAAYRNFTDEPLPEPLTEGTFRATIWAMKP